MKIHLDTKIIGKTCLHFAELNSTNVYAYQLLSNSNPIEGTAIIADYQSGGRGQYGRIWASEPGQNLLVSVIVMPKTLLVKDLHMLNVMLSVTVCQVLESYSLQDVRIKWPNDIFLSGSKTAGLLIQNLLQGDYVKASVLGVGLNVNQREFNGLDALVTSMCQILGQSISMEQVTARFFQLLDENYARLMAGKYNQLLKTYNQHWLLNQTYENIKTGELFIIQGLLIDGMISAQRKNGTEIRLPADQIRKVENPRSPHKK